MKKAFVNSLPKSGTNLVGKCLELFDYKQLSGFASSQVLSNSWKSKVRRVLWHPSSHGYIIGIDTPVEVSRRIIDKRLARAGDATFVFGHIGYTTDLLYRVQQMGFEPFVMLRDPRAVLNSFVHYAVSNTRHVLHEDFLAMSLEERYLAALRGFYNGKASLQPMAVRCNALDPWVNSKDVQLLQFERLVGNKGGGSDEQQRETLEILCDKLDIDKAGIDRVMTELHGPGRSTFRKGQIDSWKEETPAELHDVINEELADILPAWGYAKEI